MFYLVTCESLNMKSTWIQELIKYLENIIKSGTLGLSWCKKKVKEINFQKALVNMGTLSDKMDNKMKRKPKKLRKI